VRPQLQHLRTSREYAVTCGFGDSPMSVQKARSMRSRRTGSDPLAAALGLVRDFFFGW